MRPFLRFGDRGDGLDLDRRAIREFQELWDAGETSIEEFWAGLGAGRSLSLLSSLVKVDLKARFDRGETPGAADYFARFPELTEDGDRAISLVYEEFCILEEGGGQPDSAEFCERYAAWGDSLRSQLGYHRELSRVVGPAGPAVEFPIPGERFESYQLRSILGKGGAAQVYLAIDEKVGGRKVALKVSSSIARETSILANLDHPNIVPVHRVTDPTETGLQGVCMPYRPGITLEKLILRVGRGRPGRKAKLFWDAMEAGGGPAGRRTTGRLPGWEGFPTRGTYLEAVAWLGAALAEAVAYLHSQGVLHRDIKPANVLLADREGPQLLDFHLARAPNAPPHAQAALNGGTLPYMAPEQLRAFIDPDRWDDVGTAADIYALGLVLREMVTGLEPDLPDQGLPLPRAISGLLGRRMEPAESVREINPAIPPSLAAIIDRCLDPEPDRRHASARLLADDLNLFLARRPLVSATNPSHVERFANLLYHRRKVLTSCLAILVVFLSGTHQVPRPPAPLPDRAEFRAAVDDLDSDEPGRWTRAKVTFEQLHKVEPRSAWPHLYLGLTLEKLGDIAGADSTIKEAENLDGIDEAIDRRLGEVQPSATLLMVRGSRLVTHKHFDEADRVLNRILAREPRHLGAIVTLGKLESDRRNWPRAIAHYREAIALNDHDPNVDVHSVLTCRSAILRLLDEWGTSELKRAGNPVELTRAASLFGQMADELEQIRRGSRVVNDRNLSEKCELTLVFYAGLMETGRGSIAIKAGDVEAAGRWLESARKNLERARGFTVDNSSNTKSLRDSIDERLAEVARYSAQIPPLRPTPASGGRG